MPIFEYRCQSCGSVMEKIQRQPKDEMTCPKCEGKATRIISKPSAATTCSGSAQSGFT